MSAGYPYDTVVPVDGFSSALVSRWSYLAGTQPLTEQGLVKAGVYANRLTFDDSLLVRDAGDAGYHKRSVTDSLTVPVVAGRALRPSSVRPSPRPARSRTSSAARSP
ncbi:MAG TPA: hypothetical protein VGP36_15085 [Mycobacteriales bacterium]|jgi:hypothetical protein|nr:hypothetical protein [Mycobacteriales bacterium]